jgi:hypothetical protein
MPDNSWCTSLIGGQKHELPLVVFTVIEEIYRRGKSSFHFQSCRTFDSPPSSHNTLILLDFFTTPLIEATLLVHFFRFLNSPLTTLGRLVQR